MIEAFQIGVSLALETDDAQSAIAGLARQLASLDNQISEIDRNANVMRTGGFPSNFASFSSDIEGLRKRETDERINQSQKQYDDAPARPVAPIPTMTSDAADLFDRLFLRANEYKTFASESLARSGHQNEKVSLGRETASLQRLSPLEDLPWFGRIGVMQLQAAAPPLETTSPLTTEVREAHEAFPPDSVAQERLLTGFISDRAAQQTAGRQPKNSAGAEPREADMWAGSLTPEIGRKLRPLVMDGWGKETGPAGMIGSNGHGNLSLAPGSSLDGSSPVGLLAPLSRLLSDAAGSALIGESGGASRNEFKGLVIPVPTQALLWGEGWSRPGTEGEGARSASPVPPVFLPFRETALHPGMAAEQNQPSGREVGQTTNGNNESLPTSFVLHTNIQLDGQIVARIVGERIISSLNGPLSGTGGSDPRRSYTPVEW